MFVLYSQNVYLCTVKLINKFVNTKFMSEKVSMRSTIGGLEVGQETSFPLLQLQSVKTTACDLGLIHGRQYSTRIARSERLVYVTRNS